MGVLPVPLASIRLIGTRRYGKCTFFSINSLRPEKILGSGGGSSPGPLDANEALDHLPVVRMVAGFDSGEQ
jgi:hypothetical protein